MLDASATVVYVGGMKKSPQLWAHDDHYLNGHWNRGIRNEWPTMLQRSALDLRAQDRRIVILDGGVLCPMEETARPTSLTPWHRNHDRNQPPPFHTFGKAVEWCVRGRMARVDDSPTFAIVIEFDPTNDECPVIACQAIWLTYQD